MLILLSIIFFIVGVIGWIFGDEYDRPLIGYMGLAGAIAWIITLVAMFFIILFYPYKVDEKIAMYEEENTKIEEKVRNSVTGYMDFENDTLKNLVNTSDLQTLIMKYPELKSNELVQMEIETYKENSKQIKKLKEQSIIKPTLSWWLFFGK